MGHRLSCALLALALASPAAGVEVLVFKKDGRYRGTGLRVQSVETTTDGRLIIRGIDGELLSADASEVDWQASREHSARYQELERESAEKRRAAGVAAARAEHRALVAEAREVDNVVAASRRYGVKNPAVTVASGGAAAPTPLISPARQQATLLTAAASKLSSRDGAVQVAVAASKLRQAQAVAKAIEAKITELRRDPNTDPVAAALRNSQIERRSTELEAANAKLAEAERGLARATALAAVRSAGSP